MDTEVGNRIHLIVGALAETRPSTTAVLEAVNTTWRTHPLGGTTASSARLRCATAVSIYFARCRPTDEWKLTGVEVPLREAIADLVWVDHAGGVMIDELKSGKPDPTTGATRDQLERLAVGGRRRYGNCFRGVRFVPLSAPAGMRVFDVNRRRQLIEVVFPDGSELR